MLYASLVRLFQTHIRADTQLVGIKMYFNKYISQWQVEKNSSSGDSIPKLFFENGSLQNIARNTVSFVRMLLCTCEKETQVKKI